MLFFDCPYLESQLKEENGVQAFKEMERETRQLFTKGGTAFIQLDSEEQATEDPKLDLLFGNSWFSLNLLNPELLKTKIRFEQSKDSSKYPIYTVPINNKKLKKNTRKLKKLFQFIINTLYIIFPKKGV